MQYTASAFNLSLLKEIDHVRCANLTAEYVKNLTYLEREKPV